MNHINIQHDQTNIIREKSLKTFLEIYEKCLTQKLRINFEDIFEKTLISLNLYEYKSDLELEVGEYLEDCFNQIYRHSFLKPYIEESHHFEILLHGPNFLQLDSGGPLQSISIEIENTKVYQLSLETMVLKEKKEWNYKTPFISFNTSLFGHQFRATLVHFSITPGKSSKVFLRRLNSSSINLSEFNISNDTTSFLSELIRDKKNILIAGSTGSGKTTFLKSLMSLISQEEHIVVLEDTYEINSTNIGQSNLLACEGTKGKTLKDFCSYAMRMRPDRMIIGEMRSHEVVPFVLAMNTGHKGLMSTIHANNASDAISRMALLFSIYSETRDLSFELITKLVSQNIDYIIFLEDKSVKEIIKVLGSEKERIFYETIHVN